MSPAGLLRVSWAASARPVPPWASCRDPISPPKQKTNTKKQSQSDITGKSAGDGELTIAISQASPKAQKKLLTDVVGATKEQIEEVNKATSTAPDVVNKEIDKDPVAEMTKAVKMAKLISLGLCQKVPLLEMQCHHSNH